MSTILVDNLTGKTSAGSITVTSEGGAATQSLQQGLAKAWINFNGSTFATNDSLNVASNVDNGTGDYTVTVTNAFNNDDYATAINANSNNDAWYGRVKSTGGTTFAPSTYTSTAVNFGFGGQGGSTADTSLFTAAYFGDLA